MFNTIGDLARLHSTCHSGLTFIQHEMPLRDQVYDQGEHKPDLVAVHGMNPGDRYTWK